MDNLFVETDKGKKPIEQNIISKYKLGKGTVAPFSGSKIVGPNGDCVPDKSVYDDPDNKATVNKADPEDSENITLETSEIIDFSQGSDSDTGQ